MHGTEVLNLRFDFIFWLISKHLSSFIIHCLGPSSMFNEAQMSLKLMKTGRIYFFSFKSLMFMSAVQRGRELQLNHVSVMKTVG